MEPLPLGPKAMGTSAFKKSMWLETFVYFMEERVEFQISFRSFSSAPSNGCKGHSTVSAEFRTTGLPKVCTKSRQRSPL